jgi:hypothetical protein
MCLRKKSAQIREILISESAWEEMTCLFAPSLVQLPEFYLKNKEQKAYNFCEKMAAKNIVNLLKSACAVQVKKFVKTIQTGMVMLVFVCLNSIHLIFVRGKPQRKPFTTT